MQIDVIKELLKAIEIVHGKAAANAWQIVVNQLTKKAGLV